MVEKVVLIVLTDSSFRFFKIVPQSQKEKVFHVSAFSIQSYWKAPRRAGETSRAELEDEPLRPGPLRGLEVPREGPEIRSADGRANEIAWTENAEPKMLEETSLGTCMP